MQMSICGLPQALAWPNRLLNAYIRLRSRLLCPAITTLLSMSFLGDSISSSAQWEAQSQRVLRVAWGLLVGNGVDETLGQMKGAGEQAQAVLEAEPSETAQDWLWRECERAPFAHLGSSLPPTYSAAFTTQC